MNKNGINCNKNYGKCNFYLSIETINKSQSKMFAIKLYIPCRRRLVLDNGYCNENPHISSTRIRSILCQSCYVTFRAYTQSSREERKRTHAPKQRTNTVASIHWCGVGRQNKYKRKSNGGYFLNVLYCSPRIESESKAARK